MMVPEKILPANDSSFVCETRRTHQGGDLTRQTLTGYVGSQRDLYGSPRNIYCLLEGGFVEGIGTWYPHRVCFLGDVQHVHVARKTLDLGMTGH